MVPSLQLGGAEHVGVYLSCRFSSTTAVSLCAVYGGPLKQRLLDHHISFRLLASEPHVWRRALLGVPGLRSAWHRLSDGLVSGRHEEGGIVLAPTWRYAAVPEVHRRFRQLLNAHRYDVIHLHSLYCASLIPLARAHATAIVFGHHNILSERHTETDVTYLSSNLRYVDAVVCATQVSCDDFTATTGFPAARTRVIANPSCLTRAGCRRLRHPLRFGAISNLGPAKGIDVLLNAWSILYRNDIRLDLTIAGGDSAIVHCWRARARTLNLHQHTTFVGSLKSVTAVDEFYDTIDVVLIPSRTEGFSIVAVEAMSKGIPVIASDIPALREVLGDAALFFNNGDAEALADRIADFHNAPVLARHSGQSGNARSQQLFDPSGIERQYRRLYVGTSRVSVPS